MSENLSVPTNQLLSALPLEEYQRLLPHLEHIPLALGKVLYEPGKSITDVYFPHEAMLSLVSIMTDGSTTEVGLVGSEGMIGLPIILGSDYSISKVIVQVQGTATKLSAELLKQEFLRGEKLQKLLLLYTQARLSQISLIAACKSHHTVEQRFSRWLLTVNDCIIKDDLPLTQKFISQMLGVRRASVTEAALVLQKSKIISYNRGHIRILDRKKLEAKACECYASIKQEFNRLLGTNQEEQKNS